MTRFSLRKDLPGIYFCDGDMVLSVQADTPNNKTLVPAIHAAMKTFKRVYWGAIEKKKGVKSEATR
jgi:hypothetical protein